MPLSQGWRAGSYSEKVGSGQVRGTYYIYRHDPGKEVIFRFLPPKGNNNNNNKNKLSTEEARAGESQTPVLRGLSLPHKCVSWLFGPAICGRHAASNSIL